MAEKVLLAWSGGKDCAMALYEIQQRPEYQVASLLTTLTADYDRVSMHGVPPRSIGAAGRISLHAAP